MPQLEQSCCWRFLFRTCNSLYFRIVFDIVNKTVVSHRIWSFEPYMKCNPYYQSISLKTLSGEVSLSVTFVDFLYRRLYDFLGSFCWGILGKVSKSGRIIKHTRSREEARTVYAFLDYIKANYVCIVPPKFSSSPSWRKSERYSAPLFEAFKYIYIYIYICWRISGKYPTPDT